MTRERYHRHHRSGQNGHGHSRLERSRKSGWNMNLYRIPERGKIAGVCAGIADHFDFDVWVVRLIFIGLFFVFGGLMLVLYILAWICLSPRSDDSVEACEYDEERHAWRRKTLFKHASSPSLRVQRARQRLNRAVRRIEDMEAYVTSRQYELNRKLSEIDN